MAKAIINQRVGSNLAAGGAANKPEPGIDSTFAGTISVPTGQFQEASESVLYPRVMSYWVGNQSSFTQDATYTKRMMGYHTWCMVSPIRGTGFGSSIGSYTPIMQDVLTEDVNFQWLIYVMTSDNGVNNDGATELHAVMGVPTEAVNPSITFFRNNSQAAGADDGWLRNSAGTTQTKFSNSYKLNNTDNINAATGGNATDYKNVDQVYTGETLVGYMARHQMQVRFELGQSRDITGITHGCFEDVVAPFAVVAGDYDNDGTNASGFNRDDADPTLSGKIQDGFIQARDYFVGNDFAGNNPGSGGKGVTNAPDNTKAWLVNGGTWTNMAVDWKQPLGDFVGNPGTQPATVTKMVGLGHGYLSEWFAGATESFAKSGGNFTTTGFNSYGVPSSIVPSFNIATGLNFLDWLADHAVTESRLGVKMCHAEVGAARMHLARYVLCSLLLTDHFITLHAWSDIVDGDDAPFTHLGTKASYPMDEFVGEAFDSLATQAAVKAKKGWLGDPVGPPEGNAWPNTSLQGSGTGLFGYRRYDNGLSIVLFGKNWQHSGNTMAVGTQNFTLPSPGAGKKWQRILGSTGAQTVNDGTDVGATISLGNSTNDTSDMAILLKLVDS